jgi:hypothetical protein
MSDAVMKVGQDSAGHAIYTIMVPCPIGRSDECADVRVRYEFGPEEWLVDSACPCLGRLDNHESYDAECVEAAKVLFEAHEDELAEAKRQEDGPSDADLHASDYGRQEESASYRDAMTNAGRGHLL